jgi:UDP-N-acetylglucosamine diphosphorylase/glucosamine-1-phosphate N-acetyltransferase
MNYILFDDYSRDNLLPFTFTKPVGEIRFGILTIKEKWEKALKTSISHHTKDYLNTHFPIKTGIENVFINGKICPNDALINLISNLEINSGIRCAKDLIAYKCSDINAFDSNLTSLNIKEISVSYIAINQVWDIFSKNGEAIKSDFEILTKGKSSQPLSSTNTLIGNKAELFIEEGAKIEAAILNTTTGPIYIGKDAEVMEGSAIRGPFALGEHSALKLNTKIYGATTIGPYCKVGGEINNSVIFGFSNKAHDGFLGNSVIGEWCNLGADTNNSNLKNNYGAVKIFNYAQHKMIDTGLQFCGLMMGDHSKCGINTMFNTGTVVGVGANIFGGGFPPTHIPSFSWGGAESMETYKIEKMIETAQRVYDRRALKLSDEEINILHSVFNQTKKYRTF